MIGGVHIGARALHDINWYGLPYHARLSQWGGGGYFTRSHDFYLPFAALRGGGVSTLWVWKASMGHICLLSARIYRTSFRENKPKTLVFNDWKRACFECFRENWVNKFGQRGVIAWRAREYRDVTRVDEGEGGGTRRDGMIRRLCKGRKDPPLSL